VSAREKIETGYFDCGQTVSARVISAEPSIYFGEGYDEIDSEDAIDQYKRIMECTRSSLYVTLGAALNARDLAPLKVPCGREALARDIDLNPVLSRPVRIFSRYVALR
jgi:hypothetical protein